MGRFWWQKNRRQMFSSLWSSWTPALQMVFFVLCEELPEEFRDRVLDFWFLLKGARKTKSGERCTLPKTNIGVFWPSNFRCFCCLFSGVELLFWCLSNDCVVFVFLGVNLLWCVVCVFLVVCCCNYLFFLSSIGYGSTCLASQNTYLRKAKIE